LEQIHHTFWLLPLVKFSGFRTPFFVGWNSSAILGNLALRLLSFDGLLPEQQGQPDFFIVLDLINASHSCPLEQIHHTFWLLPKVKSSGFRSPFFVGWNSFAISGNLTLRLLSFDGFLLEQ